MNIQELTLEAPDMSSVKRARSWVEERLRAVASDRSLDEAVLVTSELVTNAVRHGAEAGPVLIHLTLSGETVTISVSDAGGGVPAILPSDGARIGGLGLRIVESVSIEWGVDVSPGVTRVWAVVAL